jgi:hypothetical protein
MATRSTIAVQHADGTISQIYCHWDGYLSHNGRLLVEHYPTLERVEQLVSHGDISSLAENIDPLDGQPDHTFDNRQKDVTIFYGRDRGEENCEPVLFDDYSSFIDNRNRESYDYYFTDGKWYLIVIRRNGVKLVKITPKMIED